MQADPHGDLTTELERELGKLVKERHKTDFYILTRYPLAVRSQHLLLHIIFVASSVRRVAPSLRAGHLHSDRPGVLMGSTLRLGMCADLPVSP